MLSLIGLNVVALILETVEQVHRSEPDLFRGFEVFSVAVFTVEYLLRLWSCTGNEKYRHPIHGRLRFALTPLALVDLLAILPFYLPWLDLDLRFMRIVRVLRVAKLGRYSKALSTFGRVASAKSAELLTIFSILIILLIIASSLMYYAENDAQPDKFSSIPAAMWWGIATLTTIGYGDGVVPVPVEMKEAAPIACGLFYDLRPERSRLCGRSTRRGRTDPEESR
jgi:voltage-gated potassium channel